MKRYRSQLAVTVNDKGVLDLDTVKGCTEGMQATPGGCYGCCYAARIAAFRGWDFSQSRVRYWRKAELRGIGRELARHRDLFVRVGTMGDPSHDWEWLEVAVRNLLPANPRWVVVTKHWHTAPDAVFASLARMGVVLNTSISALDTEAQRQHRLEQYERYPGPSTLRVVTCDFVHEHPEGARLAAVQDDLLARPRSLDNPLRLPGLSYPLLTEGIIRARRVHDLNSNVLMSLHSDDVYVGRCRDCPDQCGLA